MKNIKISVKNSKWHRFIYKALCCIVGPVVRIIMGYQCKREKKQTAPGIVIANHNTDLDPALVGIGLGHVYFVASEHAFRKGFRSKLLTFVFDPIPISKAQTDSSTLREIFRRIKAGFSVCIFAEGNRSYNGVTGPVAIAAAKMVKISGAGLITYRLEGGYFTSPRWSKKMRKGRMTGSVTGRYSAEEIKSMTPEQVLNVIEQGIHEDAYERQKENPVRFKGKNLAEDIETVLYLCPLCKKIGTIRSKGNRFFCGCGLDAVYTETGFLEGSPFSTIIEWDKWQTEHLAVIINNAGNAPSADGGPICADDNQQLFKLDPASGHTLVGEGPVSISRTEFQCAGMIFPMREVTKITIVGQMTLQFAVKDGTQYEIRSAFPRSALKYREIFRILSKE
jgi:lysophospholipid acyltransferase (LPLAT)-like uncharacterized protein